MTIYWISCGYANQRTSEPMYIDVVKIPSSMMNFLVSLTAFFMTSLQMLPHLVLLYSSTRGSIILYHIDGNKHINMHTVYP